MRAVWTAPVDRALRRCDPAFTEQVLQAALAPYNRFVSEDLAAYRRQLEAARVEQAPAADPLTMDWRRGR